MIPAPEVLTGAADRRSLRSTMMDVPLTTTWILEHALRNHAEREIVSRSDDAGLRRYTVREFGARVAQLAHALVELGVGPGDRVASFGWNTHRHLELYYAVPAIGAVLHTTNIRLFPEQVCAVLQHADDKFVFVDGSLTPAIARAVAVQPQFAARPFIVMGDAAADIPNSLNYEALLAGKPPTFDWSELDERTAAILCYTSATTGDPKGVLFSHRSSVLHAFAAGLTDALGVSQRDVVMPVVPMFHVNAWGIPYLAVMVGAKLVLPGAKLDPQSLIDLISAEGVTISAGVPTVWLAVRDELERRDLLLPTLKQVVIGGSAVPPSLFDGLRERGISPVHAWGMTEMSPIGTVSRAFIGSSKTLRRKLSARSCSSRVSSHRSSPGSCSTTRGMRCAPMGRRAVSFGCGGRRSRRATSATKATTPHSRTVTFTPATFARWTPTATCRSSIARRTS